MWRRIVPVVSLFFLSPLIAEYLLGSLPMSMIAILPVMATMYGSGALLIREIARRTGGGWIAIVLLATAYGLIEEGFVTQSLFNPNYLHLRLLDFGFIPALGTGLPWLVFVISIHVIWSISVPIALSETLFGNRRADPWLGWVSAPILILLFAAGCAMVATFTYKSLPFMATPAQFIATGIAVLFLVAAALVTPKLRGKPCGETCTRPAPHPATLAILGFAAGSLLMLIQHVAAQNLHWPWYACFTGMIAVEAGFVAIMIFTTRNRVWTPIRRFALMAGGLAVYMVFGFLTDVDLHGKADLPAHAGIAVLFVVLMGLAAWRATRTTYPQLKETD